MRPAGRRLALAAVTVLGLLPAATLEAGAPTDQLRTRVDRVIKILEDPVLKTEARSGERRAAMRSIAAELFDFTEISRRSLGRHWQARTREEREDFVRLFGDLLERSYASKIELYSGEKVEYVGELLDDQFATVRTRIVTKQGTPVPVDYRMFRQGDQWRTYDVLIEGVSLVGNYRAQFNTVIQKSSYQELVRAIRSKLDETSSRSVAPPERAAPAAEPPPPAARPQNP